MAYYNDSPRVSAGRRNPLVAPIPYANVRQSIGPSGETTSFNARNLPITQPGLDDDLPSERRMRLSNEGIIPRGPSSPRMDFNTAPAPMMSPAAPAAPAAPAPASPAQPFTAPINYGSVQRKRMDSEHTNIGKRLEGMDPNDPAYPNMKAHYEALTKQLYPPVNAPAPAAQPTGPAPVLSGNAPSAAPSRPAPIDTSTPEYQQRLSQLYHDASGGLNAQRTQLTNAPAPATPPQQKAPLTPVQNDGTSQTSRNDASAQAYRNQAVIQRQMDQRNQPAPDDRAGALAQNTQAIQNVEARQAQFGAHDYNLSQPPMTPDQMAQRSLQPGVRPGAAPAQGGQQAVGGFQEGQLLHSPSNPGKYWKVVNGVPQPM